MDQEPVNKQIAYSASPRVGKFQITTELLHDGGQRPMLQALFGLCVVLDVSEHESGRGKSYIAASELFQPIEEGEEIPEYRIECDIVRPFTEEENRKALRSGRFKFYAVRKIIVRVPPAALTAAGRLPSKLH